MYKIILYTDLDDYTEKMDYGDRTIGTLIDVQNHGEAMSLLETVVKGGAVAVIWNADLQEK